MPPCPGSPRHLATCALRAERKGWLAQGIQWTGHNRTVTLAIFGAAGAIGRSIGAELDRRGTDYRVVGRNRDRLTAAFPSAEVKTADFEDTASTLEAARGVDTIIYAAGAPYTKFALHPVMMKNVVDAAIEAGVARLVVVGAVYSYGDAITPTVAETHRRSPHTYKGRMRKKQEDIAIAAHKAGEIKVLITHLPDFYGPYADLGFAHLAFEAALKGERANWMGSVKRPHEFIYVPDAGPVLLDLAALNDAYGQHWNIGGAGTITGREFLTKLYEAAGTPARWRQISGWMLQLSGMFNPLMREVAEMHYLWQKPLVLDDSKLIKRVGKVHKTPYDQGIRETIEWMRKR